MLTWKVKIRNSNTDLVLHYTIFFLILGANNLPFFHCFCFVACMNWGLPTTTWEIWNGRMKLAYVKSSNMLIFSLLLYMQLSKQKYLGLGKKSSMTSSRPFSFNPALLAGMVTKCSITLFVTNTYGTLQLCIMICKTTHYPLCFHLIHSFAYFCFLINLTQDPHLLPPPFSLPNVLSWQVQWPYVLLGPQVLKS